MPDGALTALRGDRSPWPVPAGPRPEPAPLSSKELVMLRISYMARVMAIVDAAAHADAADYETNQTEVSAAALRLLLMDSQLNSVSTRVLSHFL